jgi:hypothetical protein
MSDFEEKEPKTVLKIRLEPLQNEVLEALSRKMGIRKTRLINWLIDRGMQNEQGEIMETLPWDIAVLLNDYLVRKQIKIILKTKYLKTSMEKAVYFEDRHAADPTLPDQLKRRLIASERKIMKQNAETLKALGEADTAVDDLIEKTRQKTALKRKIEKIHAGKDEQQTLKWLKNLDKRLNEPDSEQFHEHWKKAIKPLLDSPNPEIQKLAGQLLERL